MRIHAQGARLLFSSGHIRAKQVLIFEQKHLILGKTRLRVHCRPFYIVKQQQQINNGKTCLCFVVDMIMGMLKSF